jgi:hypothetical protein
MNRASAITSRSAFERAAHVVAVAATLILAAPRPAPAADSAQKAACLRASEEGQRMRAAGRLREARSSFLVCARDQCPAVVRDDCATWTGDVTDAMPSVIFSAHDPAGHPTTAVTVEVDGEAVATHLDGAPILLDPGEHHLRFVHPGARPVERTLTLNKGEKRRSIVVDLEAPSAPAPPPPAPAPLTTTILPPAPPATPHRSATRFIGPLAFGGAGIVALGIGTYLLVHASSDVSALESSCSPYCGHDAVDRLRTRALTGDVLLGIGATSLLAGGYLYFFTQPRASDAPPRSARAFTVDLTLAPSHDGGRALLQGTF